MNKHAFNPTGVFLLITENLGPASEEFMYIKYFAWDLISFFPARGLQVFLVISRRSL